MKTKTILFTLIATSTLLGATAILHAFEGRLDMTVTNTTRGSEARPVTIYAKNELLRAEYTPAAGPRGREAGPMVSIIDRSKHEATTLIVNRKVYMTHPLAGKVASKVASNFSQTEFKPTGRKDTIAGIAAEEYAGTSENNKYTELWVTKDLGQFLLDNPGMGETSHTGGLTEQAAWSRFAFSQNFFVLRAVEYDRKGGKEIFHLEVTKVDRTAQPDSLFTVPSGYKKIEQRDWMR